VPAQNSAALLGWNSSEREPIYQTEQLRRNPMAYYPTHRPNTEGEVNSAFNVAFIAALFAFAVISTYFYG
jgi:hypothetical protein